MKKWIVRLEAEERERLRQLVRVGKTAAYKIRRANVLLAVDESEDGAGLPDARVAETLRMGVRSIESLRRRFVEEGLEVCLTRKKQERPSVQRMFDGEKEAKLIAVACGPAPKDRARSTLKLPVDRVTGGTGMTRCLCAWAARIDCHRQTPAVYYQLGDVALKQRRPHLVLERETVPVRKNPRLPDGRFDRGIALLKPARAYEATAEFRAALELGAPRVSPLPPRQRLSCAGAAERDGCRAWVSVGERSAGSTKGTWTVKTANCASV